MQSGECLKDRITSTYSPVPELAVEICTRFRRQGNEQFEEVERLSSDLNEPFFGPAPICPYLFKPT